MLHLICSRQVAKSYAQEMGILFLETSAKTGKNVKEVFLEIARRLPISSRDGGQNGKKLTPGENPPPSSGCCG